MADPSTLKRMKVENVKLESLLSLPSDMLLIIFGKVASHSVEDITNVKFVCSQFHRLAETNYIYERVSLSKFAVGPLEWVTNAKPFMHRVKVIGRDDGDDARLEPLLGLKRRREVHFLQRCRESGNAEVLYREGFVNYFRESSTPDVQAVALEGIIKAALKGHLDAKYTCSMIMMAGVDEDQKSMGFDFFRSLDNANVLLQCRQNVRKFMRSLWVRKEMVFDGIPICNSVLCETPLVEDEPETLQDEENSKKLGSKMCQRCKADFEIFFFCITTIV